MSGGIVILDLPRSPLLLLWVPIPEAMNTDVEFHIRQNYPWNKLPANVKQVSHRLSDLSFMESAFIRWEVSVPTSAVCVTICTCIGTEFVIQSKATTDHLQSTSTLAMLAEANLITWLDEWYDDTVCIPIVFTWTSYNSEGILIVFSLIVTS